MRKIVSIILLGYISLSTYGQQVPIDSLQKHIKYLASKELKGRKAGSEGDSLAADYIKSYFNKFQPGKASTQHFYLVTDVIAGKENSMQFEGLSFTAGKDFQPFSFSSSSGAEGSVVFAGFGIVGQSDSLKWDDYNNLDVAGKWVMLLRGDPEPDNPSSSFIPQSSDRAKALTAKDKGAKGVLLVSPSSIDRTDQTIDISFDKSVSDSGIPVISITRKTAGAILKLTGSPVDSLEKQMLASKKPVSFELKGTLSAATEIIREKKVSRNIINIIEGNNPALKDEYIVIGAHYDHLGEGGQGSGSRVPDTIAIHPGADDNASGVAALIELSRFFSMPENHQGRSLIFIVFGAEEMGLVGSRYFVDNKIVPSSSIKAMINLDMVGRLGTDGSRSITIYGTGTFKEADSILNRAEKEHGFAFKRIADGYGPSDHSAFYTSGIPVLFLTTGAHPDYHTPTDIAQSINFPGLSDVTALTADIVKEIVNLPQAPLYVETGTKRASGHYGRNLKVTLGIMPDVTGSETHGGMKVEATRKGAPADRGGMLKGDIITAINGMKVSNVYDYMSRLGKLKPGETVNVEVLRANKKEILIIQL